MKILAKLLKCFSQNIIGLIGDWSKQSCHQGLKQVQVEKSGCNLIKHFQ